VFVLNERAVRDKLKEVLPSSNAKTIKQFADLMESFENSSSNTILSLPDVVLRDMGLSKTLKDIAKEKTREKAIAEGTSAASFGTSNLIIISGENTVQSIINAIPNQGEGAQVFDPKRNLTAYKDQDGTIVVSQGRPVTANGKQAKLPEHRFGKY